MLINVLERHWSKRPERQSERQWPKNKIQTSPRPSDEMPLTNSESFRRSKHYRRKREIMRKFSLNSAFARVVLAKVRVIPAPVWICFT